MSCCATAPAASVPVRGRARTPVELEALARRAGRELEDAPADEVLRWAGGTFGDRFALTGAMGETVLTHLASRVLPGVDVVFLDTGYHFAETLGTRDAVAAMYDVNVVTVQPEQTVAEQDAAHGPRLHERAPDLCCTLRKVAPLDRALAPYDAWASGIRRAESPTRARTRVVEWDSRRGKVKIAPLARWTQEDMDAYASEHGALVNPLLYDGYASIGCGPCTRRVAPGEHPRAGRWSGLTKTECGIHPA